jgi:hypothetical protein
VLYEDCWVWYIPNARPMTLDHPYEQLNILENCPNMRQVILPMNQPWTALQAELTKRKRTPYSYNRTAHGEPCKNDNMKHLDIILFECKPIDLPPPSPPPKPIRRKEIAVNIRNCPNILRLIVNARKPLTGVRWRVMETDLAVYPFMFTIQGVQCTDFNLYDECTIDFHYSLSAAADNQSKEEYTVYLKNCPTFKECKVTARSPWFDLRRQIEDSGINVCFNCWVNGKFCSNMNMFPNATIHFSFKLQGGMKPRSSSDSDSSPTKHPDSAIQRALAFWREKNPPSPEYILQLRRIQAAIKRPWLTIFFASSWIHRQFANHFELWDWLRDTFPEDESFRIFFGDVEVARETKFEESWRLNIRLADGITQAPCNPLLPVACRKQICSKFNIYAEETEDHIGMVATIQATAFEVELRARESIWRLYQVENSFCSLTCRSTGSDLRSCKMGGDTIDVHWKRSIQKIAFSRMIVPYQINLKMDSGIELRVAGPMLTLPRLIREKMFTELGAPTGEYWLPIDGAPFSIDRIRTVITDLHVEWKGPAGCCETENSCMRVLVENCPNLRMAVLDSLTPTRTLYSIIQSRGYKEGSFKLYVGQNLLSDEIIFDGASIHFEETVITLFIEDCPTLLQFQAPMNTPWASVLLKFRELGYPDDVYMCTVNTHPCNDNNLFNDCHIRFHIKPKGGGQDGPVIEGDTLDDVDYPDSSSSSDSEGDEIREHQWYKQERENRLHYLQEKIVFLKKFLERNDKGSFKTKGTTLIMQAQREELAKYEQELANYPRYQPYQRRLREGKDTYEPLQVDDDVDLEDTPITGDERFPPELKVANPVQDQEVTFQDGKYPDTYQYNSWQRKWIRMTAHPDEIPKHPHKHYHEHLDIIDSNPKPGEDAWRIVARKAGEAEGPAPFIDDGKHLKTLSETSPQELRDDNILEKLNPKLKEEERKTNPPEFIFRPLTDERPELYFSKRQLEVRRIRPNRLRKRPATTDDLLTLAKPNPISSSKCREYSIERQRQYWLRQKNQRPSERSQKALLMKANMKSEAAIYDHPPLCRWKIIEDPRAATWEFSKFRQKIISGNSKTFTSSIRITRN